MAGHKLPTPVAYILGMAQLGERSGDAEHAQAPTGPLLAKIVPKAKRLSRIIDNMFKLCKKVGFEKIVFGSDIITDPNLIARMNEEFTFRTKWFSAAEILRQATSLGGELLDMSKRFNPGKLGVIEAGGLAEILLINGDPLKDISILTKPDENLALIMKEGKIYKNTGR